MDQRVPSKTAEEPTSAAGDKAVTTGILFLIATTLCFTGLDTTAKYLTDELPPLQIVWMRFIVHMLIMTPILIAMSGPERPWKSNRPVTQIIRSAFMVITTLLNFLAISTMQLAEAISIFFITPLIVAAIAGPLLNEWAGPRRWAAIIVGFIGVIIITQPGTGNLDGAVFFAIGAATFFSFYTLATRVLVGKDSSITTIFYTPLVGAFAFAPWALSVWVMPPDPFHWFLLMMTGVWGSVGHLFLIEACRRAPTPVLAPFIYVQLIWMTISGYLVFADIPTAWTFIGAAIVVASGLYLWFREQRAVGGHADDG